MIFCIFITLMFLCKKSQCLSALLLFKIMKQILHWFNFKKIGIFFINVFYTTTLVLAESLFLHPSSLQLCSKWLQDIYNLACTLRVLFWSWETTCPWQWCSRPSPFRVLDWLVDVSTWHCPPPWWECIVFWPLSFFNILLSLSLSLFLILSHCPPHYAFSLRGPAVTWQLVWITAVVTAFV